MALTQYSQGNNSEFECVVKGATLKAWYYFVTSETKHHLEFGGKIFENYDSSTLNMSTGGTWIKVVRYIIKGTCLVSCQVIILVFPSQQGDNIHVSLCTKCTFLIGSWAYNGMLQVHRRMAKVPIQDREPSSSVRFENLIRHP